MNPSDLWHIVGAGAIGQYVATQLSAHTNICLHGKHNSLSQIELTDLNNKTSKVSLFEDNHAPIEVLIICTKAFDAFEAFKQYQSRLSKSCVIICLFNGMGPQFEIQNLHKKPIWFASTTEGVRKLSRDSIVHTGTGVTTFGQPLTSNNTSNFYDTHFIKALKKCDWVASDKILDTLYLKLAINSLINPLTAIYNCKNGQLLNEPKAIQCMKLLAIEISRICLKLNINLSADTIWQTTEQVLHNTSLNYSSMYQDVTFKRQTEIQLINGYWIKIGSQYNLDTKHNGELVDKVNQLILI